MSFAINAREASMRASRAALSTRRLPTATTATVFARSLATVRDQPGQPTEKP